MFCAVGVVELPIPGCFELFIVYDLGLRFSLCRFCFCCCFLRLVLSFLLLLFFVLYCPPWCFCCFVSCGLCVTCFVWLFGFGFVMNALFVIPFLALVSAVVSVRFWRSFRLWFCCGFSVRCGCGFAAVSAFVATVVSLRFWRSFWLW